MIKFYRTSVFLLGFLFLSIILHGQNKQEWAVSVEDMEEYREQTRMLIKYFEGTLNFLGDPASTIQEKDIIINQSYDKIFVNDLVQIEDDLDENRDVPVNKDVRAYLKDVDFFFRSVTFNFDIQTIEPLISENGAIYFKVTLMRQINARSITGDTINSSRLRFFEVNLDPFKKDLRIASYYTTKLNEKEELRHWWATMPQVWKDFFGSSSMVYNNIPMSQILKVEDNALVLNRLIEVDRKGRFLVAGNDTIPESEKSVLGGRRPDTVIVLQDKVKRLKKDTMKVNPSEADNRLKQISLMKEVSIANRPEFVTLEPLSQLSDLETVDISYTPVEDLTPLRNLSRLRTISLSGTMVQNLTPLQYAGNLREIHCNETNLNDISVMASFRQLERLFCSNSKIQSLDPLSSLSNLSILKLSKTPVKDLTSLKNLINLRILDLSHTAINDLSPLADLTSLQQLNIEHTEVSSIEAVRNLKAVNMVQFSNTKVSDLSPLQELPLLKRVYSDNNGVTAAMASVFMRNRPGVLVVFDSEELLAWWGNLPIYWRAIFTEQSGISNNPGTEELHQMINTPRIDLNGNIYLQEMQPLSRMINLQELNISRTEITDLSPLTGLTDLRKLDISNTRISKTDALKGMFLLEHINIENTRIESLDDLHGILNLKLVLADKSRIKIEDVLSLKKIRPEALIVYQTETLRFWWNNLNDEWKDVLGSNLPAGINPSPIQLQALADNKEVVVKNLLSVYSLEPLMPLLLLEKLTLAGTTVSDLSPLRGLKQLRQLELSGNPITDLNPLKELELLEHLNLENTSVADLSPIAGLTTLKTLNIGGTQVRTLKALATLENLEELSVFNTRLKNLSPADKLPSLKHIKCFNTRISKKTIDRLRIARPELNILYY
ncbi:MAG: leucine-rich repeat domain-containing protein [Bacteroidales bacterium]|nr:leucine-rich repeat domain-containing protein [Bacteroidales bacterium]